MTTKTPNLEPLPVPSEPLPDYGDTKPMDAPPLKKVIEPAPEKVKEVDKPDSVPATIWPW